jgi:hypothetical protein
MAKNHLTGTVQAPAYFGPLGNEPVANIISGSFHGDGTNITNVARVTANDTNDYVVTLGNQPQSLVGEPNLRFNGTRLYVNAPVTASALQLTSLSAGSASSTSYLAIDSNNNVILTSSIDTTINAEGPINSIQFHSGSGDISGSANFTFDPSTNIMELTGNLVVSGNIQAHTFDIIQTDIIEIDASGSTFFGNSNDDVHVRTGSLSVMSSSTEQLKVDVVNNITIINTGIIYNRVLTTNDYDVLKSNYIIGVDTNSNTVVVNMPDANTLSDGQSFVVKDEGGNAFNNNITIVASGSQTIDGSNSIVLDVPYSSIQLYCNGTDKFFIL